jgi:hypothetical protein
LLGNQPSRGYRLEIKTKAEAMKKYGDAAITDMQEMFQ